MATKPATQEDVMGVTRVIRNNVRLWLADSERKGMEADKLLEERLHRAEGQARHLGKALEQAQGEKDQAVSRLAEEVKSLGAKLSKSERTHAQQMEQQRQEYESVLERMGQNLFKSLPEGEQADVTEVINRFGKVLEDRSRRELEHQRKEFISLQEAQARVADAKLEKQAKDFLLAKEEQDSAHARALDAIRAEVKALEESHRSSLAEVRSEVEDLRMIYANELDGLRKGFDEARKAGVEARSMMDASARERHDEIKSLIKHLAEMKLVIPDGAVNVHVPEAPAPVVNVQAPEHKLLQKDITYDTYGRPVRTIEKFLEEGADDGEGS